MSQATFRKPPRQHAARRLTARAAMQWHATTGDPGARIMLQLPPADPYRLYEQARARGLISTSRLGFFVTASHSVATSVLRDNRFGAVAAGLHGHRVAHPIDDSLVMMDPPEHTELRRALAPRFTQRAVEERGARIDQVVHRHLDDLTGCTDFDLITEFAVRVPVEVICDLLGVPGSEHERFVRWGSALILGLQPLRTAAESQRLTTAIWEMDAFFGNLAGRRSAATADDVIGDLVRARSGGDVLAHRGVVATAGFLLLAGFETTVSLIGKAALQVLRDEGLREALLATPSIGPDLVEEVLRFDPPVQHTFRKAREPVTVSGVHIPRNGRILLLLAGANRDPAVFGHPHIFDPSRPNNRDHLAFSSGIHYCLGASLARLEAISAVTALFRRLPDVRLAGPPGHHPARNLRGLSSLRVQKARVSS